MIEDGNSIWESFNQLVFGNIIVDKNIKREVYKPIVYGIAFGTMEKHDPWSLSINEKKRKETEIINAKRKLIDKEPLKNVYYIHPIEDLLKEASIEYKADFTVLLNHPIVRELLDYRQKYFNLIKKQGGDFDVWGNFIAIKEKTMAPRHIAAIIIQGMELEIFSVVFEVANDIGETHCFQIKIFQHDGCVISFNDKRNKEKVLNIIKHRVKLKAKRMGITTTIESEDL
jgi:hypothetical protein